MRIPPDRVAWLGAEALRRLGGASLPLEKKFLLADCLQAYLPLDESQRQEYERLMQTEPYREARAMNKTVFEEGIEKGIEKGRQVGREEGRLLQCQEIAVALLEERFGPVKVEVREYINGLGLADVRQLTLRIAKAEKLADIGLVPPSK